MIMQFNQWYNQKVLSLTKKNNKLKSITLPGLCSLLEQSENGYGSVTAGILVLSDGAIFSSKCSMAIEEMSLSSCKNSWALGGCWGYFNVFRILSNSSRTCWKIFSKHVFKIIRLCPSDFVYISINLFFFEPLSKKLIFKHIFKENHKVLRTEISVLVWAKICHFTLPGMKQQRPMSMYLI